MSTTIKRLSVRAPRTVATLALGVVAGVVVSSAVAPSNAAPTDVHAETAIDPLVSNNKCDQEWADHYRDLILGNPTTEPSCTPSSVSAQITQQSGYSTLTATFYE